MVVETTLKQTKPVQVEATQFIGGSKNAKDVVDWIRENGGDAEWKATYRFAQNVDGTGQNGWSEVLYIVTTKGEQPVGINDWVVKTESGKFDAVSPNAFEGSYDEYVQEELPQL